MLFQVIIENGVKKIIPLTADAGAGNPVGTVIVVCSNQIPSNYLPLGTQYDTSLYPVLYALLGTDTTPTASALGLPTLTSGQYAIKATSGLSEGQQDNVINTLNEERSYSTSEVNTGKKWIDGKPIYRKTFYSATNWAENTVIATINNFSTLVDLKNRTVASNDLWYSEYYNIGASEYNFATVNVNGTVTVRRGGLFASSKPSYVILEYTKTTD